MREFKAALPVMQRFVASYVRMGGRVVAGTDTPQQFVVPGASLHRELQLYVAGGLTPAAALKTATADAADLLGISDRAGTVDVGKDADLVLLDADPLADISATMRIRLVDAGRVGRLRALTACVVPEDGVQGFHDGYGDAVRACAPDQRALECLHFHAFALLQIDQQR